MRPVDENAFSKYSLYINLLISSHLGGFRTVFIMLRPTSIRHVLPQVSGTLIQLSLNILHVSQKLARFKNHLIFLLRCRDNSIVPLSLVRIVILCSMPYVFKLGNLCGVLNREAG